MAPDIVPALEWLFLALGCGFCGLILAAIALLGCANRPALATALGIAAGLLQLPAVANAAWLTNVIGALVPAAAAAGLCTGWWAACRNLLRLRRRRRLRSFDVRGEYADLLGRLFRESGGGRLEFGSARSVNRVPSSLQVRHWTEFSDYIMEGFARYFVRASPSPAGASVQVWLTGTNRDQFVAFRVRDNIRRAGLTPVVVAAEHAAEPDPALCDSD